MLFVMRKHTFQKAWRVNTLDMYLKSHEESIAPLSAREIGRELLLVNSYSLLG